MIAFQKEWELVAVANLPVLAALRRRSGYFVKNIAFRVALYFVKNIFSHLKCPSILLC